MNEHDSAVNPISEKWETDELSERTAGTAVCGLGFWGHFERIAYLPLHVLILPIKTTLNLDTVADTVTRSRAEVRGIVIRLSAGTRVFAVLQTVHVASVDHQGVSRALCPDWEKCWNSESDHSHSSLWRLRIRGAKPPKHVRLNDVQREVTWSQKRKN